MGVLHALNGRHEDAIKSFETVLRKPTLDDSPQTYAANYVEWGESLAALGKSREAVPLYVKAIRSDPLYVEAYERLAVAMGPGPWADELQRLAGIGLQKHEQIYTENRVGVIQYRGAAKIAS
jgi:tetratricopeptide (TPR) repeat protein